MELFGLSMSKAEILLLINGIYNNKILNRLKIRKTDLGDEGLFRMSGAISSSQLCCIALVDCKLTDDCTQSVMRIMKSHAVRR